MTETAIDVAALIDARTHDKGFAYYRDGRVLSVKRRSNAASQWEGRVRGSRAQVYSVGFRIDVREAGVVDVDSSCSCPMEQGCKHVVAAMYAMQEEAQRGRADKSVDTAQSVSGPIEATASPHDWLDDLEGALAATVTAADSASTGGVVFRVRPYVTGGIVNSLELEVGKLRGRQREFRRGINYADLHALMGSGHARTELQEMLRLCFPPRYYDTPELQDVQLLQHRASGMLMRAMSIQQALLLYPQTQHMLAWGPPERASLIWACTPEGALRLSLDVPSSFAVMPGEPTLYIDQANLIVGELRHDLPPEMLKQVASGPSLSVEDAPAFRERLTGRLKGFIPAPPVLQRRVESAPAQPRLRLLRQDLAAEPSTATDRPVVEVLFAYGNQEIPAASSVRATYEIQGDHLLTRMRQPAAEARALEQLRCVGLADRMPISKPISTIQDCGEWAANMADLVEKGWDFGDKELAPLQVLDLATPVELTLEEPDGDSWFSLGMGIEVEGQHVDLAPMLAAAIKIPEVGLGGHDWSHLGDKIYLPLPHNKLLAVPKVRVQALVGVLQELLTAKRLGLGHAAAIGELRDNGACTIRGKAFLLDLADRLRGCIGSTTTKPPKGLCATLRPYQQHGLNWLGFLRKYKLGGILADDMGLGKTLQTLAHLLAVKQTQRPEHPSLIVAPTSVIFNWQAEAQKFSPGLRTYLHYGADRDVALMAQADLVMTSYATLTRDMEHMSQQTFDTVVLDESHVIKNPRAKAHHAVCSLRAEHRLCLTGTPMQNNLEELWAQFSFAMPGLLEPHARFQEVFRRPIEREGDAQRREQLQTRIRPFILRRSKSVVARELPPKTEMIERVEIAGAQRDLYEVVRNLMDRRVRSALEERGMARSSIVVLDALLKLRQVCCDPSLVKIPQARRVKKSAKLERLLELVRELCSEGRRMLIFSQFTSMLDVIAARLDAEGVHYQTLTGATRDRRAVVESFQRGTYPVLLLSLKAGGVGLNLTAADTVIHYDPWWNPAAEQQAADRAYRIGQDKPVFVHKLIVTGSLEERILELQRKKLDLTQMMVDNKAFQAQLSREDLQKLFAPLAS